MLPRSDSPVSILLVDDHPVVRAGYRRLLEHEPHLTVVGEAANATETLRLDREFSPSVIVLEELVLPTLGAEVRGGVGFAVTKAPPPQIAELTYELWQRALAAAAVLIRGDRSPDRLRCAPRRPTLCAIRSTDYGTNSSGSRWPTQNCERRRPDMSRLLGRPSRLLRLNSLRRTPGDSGQLACASQRALTR